MVPARNQSFWYDARNQLQNASGPWGDLTYYYDLVGNRTYAIQTPPGGGTTTTHVHNDPATSNQIASVTLGTSGGTAVRTFTHDDAGNIVRIRRRPPCAEAPDDAVLLIRQYCRQ